MPFFLRFTKLPKSSPDDAARLAAFCCEQGASCKSCTICSLIIPGRWVPTDSTQLMWLRVPLLACPAVLLGVRWHWRWVAVHGEANHSRLTPTSRASSTRCRRTTSLAVVRYRDPTPTIHLRVGWELDFRLAAARFLFGERLH